MRFYKGGVVVLCERIEVVYSYLIENMKCNFKFGCILIVVYIFIILEFLSVYGLNCYSVNVFYYDF